jgi:capsular exopolysaccharide synthesis family protein
MSSDRPPPDGGEIGRFVGILARRKWVVLTVVVVATGAAVAASSLRPAVYSATSKVLITNTNIPAAVAGVTDLTPPQDPIRAAATEAQVAKLFPVIDGARLKLGITDETTDQIRKNTTIGQGLDSDLLGVEVKNGDPARATQLANAIAAEYVTYRSGLDTAKLVSARNDLLRQIADLRESGGASGTYYEDLLANAQRLSTLATVGASNYNVVEKAEAGEKIGPNPVRDGIVAAIVGLIAGLALALLVERLDRRVRSVAEVEEILGSSLLARVDATPREGPGRRRMVAAIDRPQGSAAESFRMLRANFEFTNTVANARVVMVTSARPQEGKSTVASNLAATLAASGRKVILLDLDIRRPTIHSFFGIPQVPGATQVAAGTAELKDVTARIELPSASEALGGGEAGIESGGRLWVVPSGVQPPNPGQFIASHPIAALIEHLRELADIVIVDVPPILACGDAKSLAPVIDAMLLVVRLSDTTRPVLEDLRREVDATPCTALGVVVTGAVAPVNYGYYVMKDSDDRRPSPSDRSSLTASK